jgi:rod shape-determining protein MreD
VRRTLATLVAAVLAMLLQTTLLPTLFPRALVPNLTLVLVVWLGLRQRGAGGAIGAFLLGYFLDTFSGTILGLNAFAFTAVYVAVYLVGRTLWTENGGPTAVAVAFAGALVHATAAVTITWLVEAGAPIWQHAWRYGLLQAGLAALVTPFVFAFLGWEQRVMGQA